MPVPRIEPVAPAKGTALYRHFGDVRAGYWAVHALLLQVMHPDVSAGVAQYSVFRDEAWHRLYETVMSLGAWVYGGQEGAELEARRLRELHTRFTGTRPDGLRYTALAPAPWAWVFATLIKGSIDAQQYFGRRLSPQLLEEMWQQARHLGAVMGIRARDLPDTWAGFEEYFADVQRTQLRRTQSSDDVLAFIRDVKPPAPLRWVPSLVWKPLMWIPSRLALLVTAGTLPPELRDELGLPWSRGRAAALSTFRFVVRAISLVIPQRLQILPSVLIGKAATARLRKRARRADTP